MYFGKKSSAFSALAMTGAGAGAAAAGGAAVVDRRRSVTGFFDRITCIKSSGATVGGYIALMASPHAAATATGGKFVVVGVSGATVGGMVSKDSMPPAPVPRAKTCNGMSSGPTFGTGGKAGIDGGGGGGALPTGGIGTAGGTSFSELCRKLVALVC